MTAGVTRRTLRSPAALSGLGLFTARKSTLSLRPAAAGHGLKIHRTDMPYALPFEADAAHVGAMPGLPGRNTVLLADPALIAGSHNPFLATVEHVLSALAGLGITDALLECDGPEVPIMDGSALPFVEAIRAAGTLDLAGVAHDIAPTHTIRVGNEHATIEIHPRSEPGCEYEYTLDFGAGSAIPASTARFTTTDSYDSAVAPARTFCLEHEARALTQAGLFKHLTPRDMLVLDTNGKPIDNDLRFPDEPARHKLLDLIGDLALAGRRLRARIVATKSGHALNHAAAKALATLGGLGNR